MVALQFSDMHAKTLGARLLNARRNENLTQQQIAQKIGVSRSLISQWENGDIEEIGASNLYAAAKLLRVSMDWLLEGEHDAIAEAQPPAYDELSAFTESWRYLTTRQRAELVEQAAQLAEHNRALLAELSDKT